MPIVPPRPNITYDPELRRFVQLLHEMMRVLISLGLIQQDAPNSWTLPSAAVADEALETAQDAQEAADTAQATTEVLSDDIGRRFALLVFHFGNLFGVPPGLEEDFNTGAAEAQK